MGKAISCFIASILFFACTVMLLILSCTGEGVDPNQKTVHIEEGPIKLLDDGNRTYKTIVMDSCEYIYVSNANASWGSHKGNCKFCAERLQKDCRKVK